MLDEAPPPSRRTHASHAHIKRRVPSSPKGEDIKDFARAVAYGVGVKGVSPPAAPSKFPAGWKTLKPYLRVVKQPAS